ncbi:MAG: D-alanyl-D-alanine carboxypeptidase/D-alanyl-D-alanine-endopeptidase [Deltaproteobacteria bacterium]|nr:D-alanyl-D-alanine carboxypeptidase/D-alanyl-D-alanine-endopeptidase [Deltaproteobacteria bacterium]
MKKHGYRLLSKLFILVWSFVLLGSFSSFGKGFGKGGGASRFREALADVLCSVDLLDVRVGAVVIDLETGRLLFGHNQDELFNPASVSKLFTVAAALDILRPEYKFPTIFKSVSKPDKDGVLHGNLYVIGRGDPSLVSESMYTMVRSLREIGLKRVTGRLIVDESYFDEVKENTGWNCDDSSAAYRARAGAFSLNFNSIRMMVRPGARPGLLAQVVVSPDCSYVKLENHVTTSRRRTWIKYSSHDDGKKTVIQLKGRIYYRSGPRRIYARVMDPAAYAGSVLAEMMNRQGIRIKRNPLVRPVPNDANNTILVVNSPPLGQLVRNLFKKSNNFQAEQLLKVLGAHSAGAPGTWENGMRAVQGFLAGIGIRPGSYRYRNGSGLGDANLFTPMQITKLIRWVVLSSGISPEFLSALPIAAADGTIRSRMADTSADRNVRAKTGSLESVSALAGVVGGPGRGGLVFAMIMNGRLRGRIRQMWKFQDAFAAILARKSNIGTEENKKNKDHSSGHNMFTGNVEHANH